jgi:hypothetical protein
MLTCPNCPLFAACNSSWAWLSECQRYPRVADHGFAIPGGAHAARQAIEQRDLQHVFQVLEQFAGRRLAHVQHQGRAVDIALFGQCYQQQQLPGLEPGADKPVVVICHAMGWCRVAHGSLRDPRVFTNLRFAI